MTSSMRIIVTGMMGQYPFGGMTWHYLQYVIGLARLGHDVYYVEHTGAAPYDPATRMVTADCGHTVRYLTEVMARFGLDGRWAYACSSPPQWFGMTERRRREVIRTSDLLLDISGTLAQPDEYRRIPRLAFVDTDPVFNQIAWINDRGGFRRQVNAHDVHFSFAGQLRADVDTGHRWRPTRQPIVLSLWTPSDTRPTFTTVMNWNTRNKPVLHNGQPFGQKDVELARFLDLPSMVMPARLEIALNPGKGGHAPIAQLASKGWQVVDPERVCVGYDDYRQYVRSSKAEWSVAKHGYVTGQSGWFSERSACYLAAGRPVVVQDTGFGQAFPVGKGLLAFRTIEDAAAAIGNVEADYRGHSAAAFALAHEYFDSDKVLRDLLDEAWTSPAPAPATAERRPETAENA